MVSSKGRTWLYVGITSFKGKVSLTFLLLLFAAPCFASGGACPASSPLAGTSNCYFISAQSGASDSNSGTSESSPWLHAPGMPKCTGNCATVQSSFGGAGSIIHVGIIFRGGDSWHFGNSGATPYTGGEWQWFWHGTTASCVYEVSTSGCNYIGVDPTWYSGGSWSRPIFTGDNPVCNGTSCVNGSTSTKFVTSCAYQIGSQTVNRMFQRYEYLWVDNIEFTGFCVQDTTNSGSNGNAQVMMWAPGTGLSGVGQDISTNLYFHGWSETSGANDNNAINCTMISGGIEVASALVVDGSDSNPALCSSNLFASILHLNDSIFRYSTQGVGGLCHDIHDNIWEHWFTPYAAPSGTHGNGLECNSDLQGSSPNVFYNNIFRHDDPGFVHSGNPHWWLSPGSTAAEYWFNNLEYDIGGQAWDVCGTSNDSKCTGTAGVYMFNNTLVDVVQPCYLGLTPPYYGTNFTIANEHLINTPLDGGSSTPCNGYNSATNVAMSDATATSQGYTTGSGGTSGGSNTCANDGTEPCSPTASSKSTVGAGANKQSYCTTLASYSSDPSVGTDASNACKYGTTDGCSYNSTTHTMSCPAKTTVARPSGAWDAGVYQYTGGPPPPTGLTAVVN